MTVSVLIPQAGDPPAPTVELDPIAVVPGSDSTPVSGIIQIPQGTVPESVTLQIGGGDPITIPIESLQGPDENGNYRFSINVPSNQLQPGTPVEVIATVRDPQTGKISGPGEDDKTVPPTGNPPAPIVGLDPITVPPGSDSTPIPVSGIIRVPEGTVPDSVTLQVGGGNPITIPVESLQGPDENGNYRFTVEVPGHQLQPGAPVDIIATVRDPQSGATSTPGESQQTVKTEPDD
ncbi:hypothetical protein SAMN02745117_02785, partial [Lampropedia hyalina DSM 16112]